MSWRWVFKVQGGFEITKTRVIAAIVGFSLLAMVTAACGTLTGTAVGEGEQQEGKADETNLCNRADASPRRAEHGKLGGVR